MLQHSTYDCKECAKAVTPHSSSHPQLEFGLSTDFFRWHLDSKMHTGLKEKERMYKQISKNTCSQIDFGILYLYLISPLILMILCFNPYSCCKSFELECRSIGSLVACLEKSCTVTSLQHPQLHATSLFRQGRKGLSLEKALFRCPQYWANACNMSQ